MKIEIDEDRAVMLRRELTKVRCWISGWEAAQPLNSLRQVPGANAIRLAIMAIDDGIAEAHGEQAEGIDDDHED